MNIINYCGKEFCDIKVSPELENEYKNIKYMISKDGDLYSKDRNRLIEHTIDEYGTHKISLATDINCQKHKFRICDLLKYTFNIENHDPKTFDKIIKEDTEFNNRANANEITKNGKIFKVINLPGYSEYMISDDGDVITKRSGELMIPRQDKDGYLYILLWNKMDGVRHTIRIQRAVMYTYGPSPDNIIDPTVDHIDGNILNNHISNLRWLSRSDNSSGINRPNTFGYYERVRSDIVVSIENVHKICKMFEDGLSYTDIYNALNGTVSRENITRIHNKQCFESISNMYDYDYDITPIELPLKKKILDMAFNERKTNDVIIKESGATQRQISRTKRPFIYILFMTMKNIIGNNQHGIESLNDNNVIGDTEYTNFTGEFHV